MNRTDPELDAMLLACAAEPEDDTRRLALADWYQEHGDEPRAGFIRDQIRLRHIPTNPLRDFLWVKCDLLRKSNEASWRRSGLCSCKEHGGSASTRAGTCPVCFGTGDRGGLTQTSALKTALVAKYNGGAAQPEWKHVVHFQRGMPDAVTGLQINQVLRSECSTCDGCDGPHTLEHCPGTMSLSPTPWALAVVRYHPVTQFVVEDRVPYLNAANKWIWISGSPTERMERAILPRAVYSRLSHFINVVDRGGAKAYDTREAAVRALALAVAEVVRSHAAQSSSVTG